MSDKGSAHGLGHPLSVPCPRCTAGIDEPCERPNGVELEKPHKDRAKRAETIHREARLRAEGDAEHRLASKRFRAVYAAARLELEQRGDWTPLAREQLESAALNMEAAAAARQAAIAKPTVPGSTGQDVVNPQAALALRYDAQALATARSLKLTPDTRGTRAPVPGEEPGSDEGGGDDAAGAPDDLAAFDELAAHKKKKATGGSSGKRSRGRRARG